MVLYMFALLLGGIEVRRALFAAGGPNMLEAGLVVVLLLLLLVLVLLVPVLLVLVLMIAVVVVIVLVLVVLLLPEHGSDRLWQY